MLFLSATDIQEAVTLSEVMDAVERAFALYRAGHFLMPPRMHLNQGDNTLLLMPCFTEDSFGTKLVTVFPGARDQDKPVINGVVVLNDSETGEPVAVLDGRALTALRTGAVGGVSVRHMAAPGAHAVGIVGAGVQGQHQALFAAAARDITDVYAHDIAPEAVDRLGEQLRNQLPGVNFHTPETLGELVAASDIIVTTTTASQPVLPNEPELLSGKHYVGIGSFKPSMREFPAAIYALLDELVVDTEHALEETGDLATPLENGWIGRGQVVTMAEYLARKPKPEERPATTFFKSVGMALFDVVVSDLVYRQATERGLGQQLDM